MDPANRSMDIYLATFSNYRVEQRRTQRSLLDLLREDLRMAGTTIKLNDKDDLARLRSWTDIKWKQVINTTLQERRKQWQEYDAAHEIQKKRGATQVQIEDGNTENNNPNKTQKKTHSRSRIDSKRAEKDPDDTRSKKKNKTTNLDLDNNNIRVIVCPPTTVNRVPKGRLSTKKIPDKPTRF